MPLGNTLESGVYFIINIYSKNYAGFKEQREGAPVSARTDRLQDESLIQWEVTRHRNDCYSFRNAGSGLFANSPHQATSGTSIEGFTKSRDQLWTITETRTPKQYEIFAARGNLFWRLPEKEIGCPVTLSEGTTVPYTAWEFIPTEVKPPAAETMNSTCHDSLNEEIAQLQNQITSLEKRLENEKENHSKELAALKETFQSDLSNEKSHVQKVLDAKNAEIEGLSKQALPNGNHTPPPAPMSRSDSLPLIDRVSIEQLKTMVTGLNFKVTEAVALITDLKFGGEHQGSARSEEIKRAFQSIALDFGQHLAFPVYHRDHRSDHSLVKLVLRSVICAMAGRMASSWTLRHPDVDVALHAAYRDIVFAETHAVATKWRVLARQHCGKADEPLLLSFMLDKICDMLVLAGASIESSDSDTSLRHELKEKMLPAVQPLVKQVIDLNRAMGLKMVQYDCEAMFVSSGTPYNEQNMTALNNSSPIDSHDIVVGTTDLGLRLQRRNANGFLEESIPLKPKIILDSQASGLTGSIPITAELRRPLNPRQPHTQPIRTDIPLPQVASTRIPERRLMETDSLSEEDGWSESYSVSSISGEVGISDDEGAAKRGVPGHRHTIPHTISPPAMESKPPSEGLHLGRRQEAFPGLATVNATRSIERQEEVSLSHQSAGGSQWQHSDFSSDLGGRRLSRARGRYKIRNHETGLAVVMISILTIGL